MMIATASCNDLETFNHEMSLELGKLQKRGYSIEDIKFSTAFDALNEEMVYSALIMYRKTYLTAED